MRPHRRQPTRVPRPWDSPGKNTWVSRHFLLQCMKVKSESEKWKWSRSVVSDPQRPHGLQPTRLLLPWDFPGRSTGVGCHCLLPYCVIPSETPLLLLNWKNKKLGGRGKRACAPLLVTNLFSWVQHLSSRQINFHFINIFCFFSSLLWSDFIPPWGVGFQAIYLRRVLKVPWIFWNGVFQINQHSKNRLDFLRT